MHCDECICVQYISPSEDDMDEDEEDVGEGDDKRPAPAPKAPHMVPRQVMHSCHETAI